MPFNLDKLTTLIGLMTERRIVRMRVDGIEIELHSDAFCLRPPDTQVVTPPPVLDKPESTLCACGHDLLTEHNDAGCLFGCPASVCARTWDKEKEEDES
jgi:hypothetical protein